MPITRNATRLERLDLVSFESRLCATLGRFFSFQTHSLHFPKLEPGPDPVYLPDEGRLLLPLRPLGVEGSPSTTLGLFIAGAVAPLGGSLQDLLPALPKVAELCLENLLLYKESICDPVTGLHTREHLLSCLEREMDLLKASLYPSRYEQEEDGWEKETQERAMPGNVHAGIDGFYARGCFALMVVRFNGLRQVVREHGYMVADSLLQALAKAMLGKCPEQALAARSGEYEFSLLLPSSSAVECRRLALECGQALRETFIRHELTQKRIGISPSFGYAVCPQDLDGMFAQAPAEQARLLLRKARLAAALAFEQSFQPATQGALAAGQIPVLGFGRILPEGGRVLGPLPLGRYLVSLGKTVNAREGQRFAVWSQVRLQPPGYAPQSGSVYVPSYRGELVLVEVRENDALAELLNPLDPAQMPETGDQLLLLAGVEQQAVLMRERRIDSATGLLAHSDFMSAWCAEREKCSAFNLLLLRLAPVQMQEEAGAGEGVEEERSGVLAAQEPAEALPEEWEGLMGKAASLCMEHFDQLSAKFVSADESPDLLGGRYGYNSLIFFLPHTEAEELCVICADLSRKFGQKFKLEASIGIARHPYLDFYKSDAPENARKALEYSVLLPAPHVGLLDSLALNINADRLFSLGDSFAAMSEYRRAILADADNTMAWNSLGVCLAGFGRPAEARRHFGEVLRRNPGDLMALYNLGHLCQNAAVQAGRGDGQEAEEARAHYERCLELSPGHFYAHIRLGQLAEQRNDTEAARSYYLRAAEAARSAEPGRESATERLKSGRTGHADPSKAGAGGADSAKTKAAQGKPALISRHLARLAMREGKEEEARELLHEALLQDPQDAFSLQMLAHLYLNADEDPAVAESLARQSVALRPDLKAGWLELARALQALRKFEEAKKAVLKAESL